MYKCSTDCTKFTATRFKSIYSDLELTSVFWARIALPLAVEAKNKQSETFLSLLKIFPRQLGIMIEHLAICKRFSSDVLWQCWCQQTFDMQEKVLNSASENCKNTYPFAKLPPLAQASQLPFLNATSLLGNPFVKIARMGSDLTISGLVLSKLWTTPSSLSFQCVAPRELSKLAETTYSTKKGRRLRPPLIVESRSNRYFCLNIHSFYRVISLQEHSWIVHWHRACLGTLLKINQ